MCRHVNVVLLVVLNELLPQFLDIDHLTCIVRVDIHVF